ncbi:MAG TPA: ATP-binding protein, partial [Spirochaetota bacterium]|nr:ATP-binding protein [Spirochaetota bacterium]
AKDREIGFKIFFNNKLLNDLNMKFIINSDKNLIYRMLSNIIKNAIEASPMNCDVTIDIHTEEIFKIEIHNYGAIPKEIRPYFFDKYISSNKFGGTGLGAYSSKLIANMLKIDLSFESSDENGTTIFIDLSEIL